MSVKYAAEVCFG